MRANEITIGMTVERAMNVRHGVVEPGSPWLGGRVVAIDFRGERADGSTYIGISTQLPSEYGTRNCTGWSLDDEDIALGKVRVTP